MDSELVVKLYRAMQHIESMQFQVETGVASGYPLFCQIARDDEQFRVLKEEAKSEVVQQIIRGRICEFLVEDVDCRYQHPRDTPVAAYLLILTDYVDLRKVKFVSDIADCSRFFWAKKTALHVLSDSPKGL
jgi:hypothetical protein